MSDYFAFEVEGVTVYHAARDPDRARSLMFMVSHFSFVDRVIAEDTPAVVFDVRQLHSYDPAAFVEDVIAAEIRNGVPIRSVVGNTLWPERGANP